MKKILKVIQIILSLVLVIAIFVMAYQKKGDKLIIYLGLIINFNLSYYIRRQDKKEAQDEVYKSTRAEDTEQGDDSLP